MDPGHLGRLAGRMVEETALPPKPKSADMIHRPVQGLRASWCSRDRKAAAGTSEGVELECVATETERFT